MISFQRAVFPLLLGAFLIIIGNTGFPCMLRLVIWISSRLVPESSGVWEELKFLLDHPRRCFTLLFPNNATWWLFWVLVVLNCIDIFLFIVLDVSLPFPPWLLQPGFWQCSLLIICLVEHFDRIKFTSKYSTSRRSLSISIGPYCRNLLCQRCRNASCDTSLVHDHDVYRCFSDCYFYQKDKCVRREELGNLCFHGPSGRARQDPEFRWCPFAETAQLRPLVRCLGTVLYCSRRRTTD